MPEDCTGLSVVFDLTVKNMDAAGLYKVLVNKMNVVGEKNSTILCAIVCLKPIV